MSIADNLVTIANNLLNIKNACNTALIAKGSTEAETLEQIAGKINAIEAEAHQNYVVSATSNDNTKLYFKGLKPKNQDGIYYNLNLQVKEVYAPECTYVNDYQPADNAVVNFPSLEMWLIAGGIDGSINYSTNITATVGSEAHPMASDFLANQSAFLNYQGDCKMTAYLAAEADKSQWSELADDAAFGTLTCWWQTNGVWAAYTYDTGTKVWTAVS